MKPEKRRAFSLVELMIVVLILGALAGIAIPRITGGVHTARVNACRSNIAMINKQIELYRQNTGSWPGNIKKVTEEADYFPDGLPECPFGEEYKMGNLGLGHEHRVLPHNH